MCLVFQNVPTLVDVIVDIIDKNEQQGQGKSWSIVGRKQSQHRPWCPLTGHVHITPDRHSSLQPDKDNNLRNFPIDSISFIQQIEVS